MPKMALIFPTFRRYINLYNLFLLLLCLAIFYFVSNQILSSQDQTSNPYQKRLWMLTFSNNNANNKSFSESSSKSPINIFNGNYSSEYFTAPASSSINFNSNILISRNTNQSILPLDSPAAQNQIDWFKIFQDTAKKVINIFSPNYLGEFRKWSVEKERDSIAQEMLGYQLKNLSINDLVMEKGGKPIRNVIFTTWRSGSTFLGDVLLNHPATFYHYEPLLSFDIVQARTGHLAQEGVRILKDLLYCRYSNLTNYLKYGEDNHWVFNHNSRVWQFCEKNHEVCWDPAFQSKMCQIFPFQSLKTVRMRLRLAKELLNDPKLDIRLLLLVRDPRGTMQSRQHRDWCPNNPDCDDPIRLCSDLVQDYYDAKEFRKRYKGRFMALRYEDISLNPYSAIKKLFKFFRLQFHPRVENFLETHTVTNIGGVSSTFRDSKTAPFHWMKDFTDFEAIDRIQRSCGKAMSLWGYEQAQNKAHLTSLDPVLPPPWPDMNIPRDVEKHSMNYTISVSS